MIKIDLYKAYDLIEWKCLESALQKIGFPFKFIDWIMECVTTPTYTVMINGQFDGFFAGARGLRQGYPLSPYLSLHVWKCCPVWS